MLQLVVLSQLRTQNRYPFLLELLFFVAIPDAKPVPTFAGIAIVLLSQKVAVSGRFGNVLILIEYRFAQAKAICDGHLDG